MRHRIVLTAILLIFIGFFAGAQPAVQRVAEPATLSGGKISGNIIDDKGLSMEAVTVVLLKAGDSSRIKETATNKAGHFVFSGLADGKYLILSSFVGYSRQYSQPVE